MHLLAMECKLDAMCASFSIEKADTHVELAKHIMCQRFIATKDITSRTVVTSRQAKHYSSPDSFKFNKINF